MHGIGKSDRLIVPGKPPNNAAGAPVAAEGVEERGLAKGNSRQHARAGRSSRRPLVMMLTRIRQEARQWQYERPTVPGTGEPDVGCTTLAEAVSHGRCCSTTNNGSLDFSRSTRPTPARLTRGRSLVR